MDKGVDELVFLWLSGGRAWMMGWFPGFMYQRHFFFLLFFCFSTAQVPLI